MALAAWSLRNRIAATATLLVAGVLCIDAVWLVLAKRAELRRDIEQRARSYAVLTAPPICEGYDTYHASGLYKFRELMREYLKLEADVERIQIATVNGEILFDSAELEKAGPRRDDPATKAMLVEGRDRLEAVKRLELTQLPARDSHGAAALEIVAPYKEDWGRHKLSVLYLVHYRNLLPAVRRLVYATGVLMLLSILASALAARALASRITRPLEG